jgi:hypothetical protein
MIFEHGFLLVAGSAHGADRTPQRTLSAWFPTFNPQLSTN